MTLSIALNNNHTKQAIADAIQAYKREHKTSKIKWSDFQFTSDDPFSNIHLAFILSQAADEVVERNDDEESLFTMIISRIPELQDAPLTVTEAVELLHRDNRLTSTNLKLVLAQHRNATEVARGLIHLAELGKGRGINISRWLGDFNPLQMSALADLLESQDKLTAESFNAALQVMKLSNAHPRVNFTAIMPANSTRYGMDNSYEAQVNARSYAFAAIINLTRRMGSWTGVTYHYSEDIRRQETEIIKALPAIIDGLITANESLSPGNSVINLGPVKEEDIQYYMGLTGTPAQKKETFVNWLIHTRQEANARAPSTAVTPPVVQPQPQRPATAPAGAVPGTFFAPTPVVNQASVPVADVLFGIDPETFNQFTIELREFIRVRGQSELNSDRFLAAGISVSSQDLYHDPVTLDAMDIPVLINGQAICLLSFLRATQEMPRGSGSFTNPINTDRKLRLDQIQPGYMIQSFIDTKLSAAAKEYAELHRSNALADKESHDGSGPSMSK
ncbi:hypothetical protein [Legionella shakespearei]|uniref:Uncharacterized protein n=1 Tax=Legionella shakespearei DSM 23087 TaxID=1122169 RepID=A0A0W0YUG5_9GAMM|nr:hypothetical protein [Legionella shakespearei]KTD60505.1 hypothetical protein Lsha_1601 [Legionella shakespearei DSM 23087]